jgi:hypothetical protein
MTIFTAALLLLQLKVNDYRVGSCATSSDFLFASSAG